MPASPPWDAIVIGRGPAASLAALRLSAEGLRVAQFIGGVERHRRPAEILSPRSLAKLQRLGLHDAAGLGSPCAGVLQAWHSPEVDYTDFAFTQALAGRAVDRRDLQSNLLRVAGQSGVNQIAARANVVRSHGTRPERVAWTGPSGERHEMESPCILIATGRVPTEQASPARSGTANLVAMTMPWVARQHTTALVLEACESGWFYSPPVVGEASDLVFITDAAVLPRRSPARAGWLESMVARAPLLSSLGGRVDVYRCTGFSARVGAVDDPVFAGGAMLGDAANALDPLSGSGIGQALDAAWFATDDVLKQGRVGDAYRAWFRAARAEQSAIGLRRNAEAATRFPASDFWRRRMIAARLQHQAFGENAGQADSQARTQSCNEPYQSADSN